MIIEKLQQDLLLSWNKIDKLKIKGLPRILVYVFAFIVLFSVILFPTFWIYQYFITKKPDLSLLISFIHEITSVPFIAAVGFFGKAMIDNNDDGIPDEWENIGGNNDTRTISNRNS
jgi:hypothetical protein